MPRPTITSVIGWRLVCPSCGRGHRADARARRCRPCHVALELHADDPDARPDPGASTLLGRYRALLPPIGADVPLTLGEGRTPLLRSAALGPLLRLERLAFKLESANPTGSWVDRGTVALIQHAREAGVRRAAVLADGGLAVSAARYAARASIGVTVVAADERGLAPDAAPVERESSETGSAGANLHPVRSEGAALASTASREVALAIGAGARLVEVRARPSMLAAALRRAAGENGMMLVEPEHPVWAAGLRTLAFELAGPENGPSPDLVVIASGTGHEGQALAAGFRAWRRAGLADREPAVLAVRLGPTSSPNGLVVDARDAGAARRLLAEEEGIAASPASAAALAGVVRLSRAGEIAPGARVVVVLADEHRGLGAPAAADPHQVGRVTSGVAPGDLARVLARPAF